MHRVPSNADSSAPESPLAHFKAYYRKTSDKSLFKLSDVIQRLSQQDKDLNTQGVLKGLWGQICLGHSVEGKLIKAWAKKAPQSTIEFSNEIRPFSFAKGDELQQLYEIIDEEFKKIDPKNHPGVEHLIREERIKAFENAHDIYKKFEELIQRNQESLWVTDEGINALENCHAAWMKTIERLGDLIPQVFQGSLRAADTRPTTPKNPGKPTVETPEHSVIEGTGSLPCTPSSSVRDARRGINRRFSSVSSASGFLQKIIEEREDKIGELKNELETLCEELDRYKTSFGKSEDENKVLKNNIEALNQQLAEYEGDLDQLKQQKGMLKKKLETNERDKRTTLSTLAREMQEEKAEHALSQGRIRELEKINRQYREQNRGQSQELTESSAALQKIVEERKRATRHIGLIAEAFGELTGSPIKVNEGDFCDTLAHLQPEIEKATKAYQAQKENDQQLLNQTSALQEKLKSAIGNIESLTLQQQEEVAVGKIDGAFQTRVSMVSAKRLNQMAKELAQLSEVVSEISPRLKALEKKQSTLESARITEVRRDQRYTQSPRQSVGSVGHISPVPLRFSHTQPLLSESRRSSISLSQSLSSPGFYSAYSDSTDVTIPDEENYAIKSKCEALKQECLNLAQRISEAEGERLVLEEQCLALVHAVGQLKENTDYLHQTLTQLDNGFIHLERIYILAELKLLVEYVGNHAYQFFSFNIAQEIFEDLRIQCQQYLLENSEDLLNTPRATDLLKTLNVAQKMLKGAYAVLPFRLKVAVDCEVPRGQMLDIFREAGHFEWLENSHYSLDISHERPKAKKEKAVLKFFHAKEDSKDIESESELEREEFVLSVAYVILDAAEKDRENTSQKEKDQKFTITLEGDSETVRQLAEYLQVGLAFYDKLCLTGKKPNIIIHTPQLKEVPLLSEEKLKSMSKRALRGIRLENIPQVTCAAELNDAGYSATPSYAASAVG